jgi:protein SCO1/2
VAMFENLRQVYLRIFGVGLMAALAASTGSAQLAGQTPPELEEVGIEEHLDAKIPLSAEFVDEHGEQVRLGDYLDGERPIILTLNYYRCPMLCGLQLNGVVEGLVQMDWTLGDQFDMVTISIDPLETPALASKQYAHAAAIFVITPDGRLARYLYGIEYPPRDLKLALLEASEGKIGSAFDQLILYCFHYDPSSRSYAPVAMNIMRLGGGATAGLLALSLGTLWVRDLRRKKTRRNPSA